MVEEEPLVKTGQGDYEQHYPRASDDSWGTKPATGLFVGLGIIIVVAVILAAILFGAK